MEVLSGLIGGVVGAAITLVCSLLTLRYSYSQLYAQTVSSNRMDWINVWRENISKFLATAEILHKENKLSNAHEYEKEMLEARAMIITRLNTSEEDHLLMYAALMNLDYTSDDNVFEEKRLIITELARKILKFEWERVKKEAKGK